MTNSHPDLTSPQGIRIIELERQLYWATLKIQSLEEKLRQRRIAMFGPHSENLDNLQMQLLELEPSVSAQEVEAEAAREALPPKPARTPKPHPGRQKLPDHLKRVTEEIPCLPEACKCASCGVEMPVIGHDESEQLDVEPARYFVKVTRREKRACRRCAEATVVAAPLAPRIIEKGLVSDRIVIETVIGKYCDHLPLYRQAVILEREAGLQISRATLDGWVMRVGDLLMPMVAAMRNDLLTGLYLQADETTVPVQMHDQRGSNHQAYLWQYGKPGGETVFDFCLGRGRAGPKRFLGNWEGILQTDGYAAYDQIGGPKLVYAACWAHARRKFVEAVKLNPHDVDATQMVIRMDALFLIEEEARKQGLTIEERHVLRQRESVAWVDEIHNACRALALRALPKSAVGQAANYTLSLWKRLRCFVDHPVLELSTNLAENSFRPVAVGRKNWLHIGSVQAGPKVAAIISVVESCRRLKVPVKEYLGAVLPGLADRPLRALVELTPAKWAAWRSPFAAISVAAATFTR